MTKLEKAKEIVRQNYKDAKYGIFDNRNIMGDSMNTLYWGDGLVIDICRKWGYFEVFGLDYEEFKILKKFYKGGCRE